MFINSDVSRVKLLCDNYILDDHVPDFVTLANTLSSNGLRTPTGLAYRWFCLRNVQVTPMVLNHVQYVIDPVTTTNTLKLIHMSNNDICDSLDYVTKCYMHINNYYGTVLKCYGLPVSRHCHHKCTSGYTFLASSVQHSIWFHCHTMSTTLSLDRAITAPGRHT